MITATTTTKEPRMNMMPTLRHHMSNGRFGGRRALITGAAQGLGYAMAKRLGAEGAALGDVSSFGAKRDLRPKTGCTESERGVMRNEPPTMVMNAAMVSVTNLDHSSEFYQQVLEVEEVLREDRIAILGSDQPGSSVLILRESERQSLHPGRSSSGVRSLGWEVSNRVKLAEIEGRLRNHNAFRERRVLQEVSEFDVVIGQDPDRLSLVFAVSVTDTRLTATSFNRTSFAMYSIDA